MSTSPYSGAAIKLSAMHFIVGKMASGLLNLGILLLLVRLLAVAEYGAYVTLQAGMVLAQAITSLGMLWVAARYLPEFRLYASGNRLRRFVWQIITLICLFLVIGALLLWVAMPWLLIPLKLTQQTGVAKLYLLVLVLEGSRLNIQACILEPLLQQGQAQLSQVVRNLALLLCLVIVSLQGTVHLHHVVLAELTGALLGITLSLRGLVRHLRIFKNLPGKSGWQAPKWSEMWRTARHMYFSYLVTLTYGSSVFIFLTQRFLGVENTALFGFLLNLYEQISRYLPASLLFGLIRPKLIASYVGEGGMEQLTRNANLVGKMSLFVLMPLLVFAWLTGGELLSLLSGGKFTQSGYYLGGMLLMLIPLSQRQILETVVVASGRSHLCFWGSALGILVLPLAYWLFVSGQGLWSPIIAMVVGQVIFNGTLSIAMSLSTSYRPDIAGLFKMMAAALVGIMVGILAKMAWAGSLQLPVKGFTGFLENVQNLVAMLPAQQVAVPVQGWLGLAIMAAVAFSLFLFTSYFFKPFRAEERMRLNRLLNRNVFVW